MEENDMVKINFKMLLFRAHNRHVKALEKHEQLRSSETEKELFRIKNLHSQLMDQAENLQKGIPVDETLLAQAEKYLTDNISIH